MTAAPKAPIFCQLGGWHPPAVTEPAPSQITAGHRPPLCLWYKWEIYGYYKTLWLACVCVYEAPWFSLAALLVDDLNRMKSSLLSRHRPSPLKTLKRKRLMYPDYYLLYPPFREQAARKSRGELHVHTGALIWNPLSSPRISENDSSIISSDDDNIIRQYITPIRPTILTSSTLQKNEQFCLFSTLFTNWRKLLILTSNMRLLHLSELCL